jgi:hypothetical protein
MIRLLQVDGNQVSLVPFLGTDVPEYAILSHTWGPNGTEVTFEDITNCNNNDNDKPGYQDKPGYAKIKFCAQQAARDGLRYFWVDTCCIAKSSDPELSEAIRSMFRWYSAAARCYVYLSDVPDTETPKSTAEDAFPKSRWFTRGWTLQELIAPKSVGFFSRDGIYLGNKMSRERQLNQITGIDIETLQGTKPLHQVAVADRLSWAVRRNTTLEEDAAYCLLGIFNIHMPVMYGEGRDHAMDRLQVEIQKRLNPSILASKDIPWIVPFQRNPNFTGRESQLAQLETKLFAKDHTAKIAITGLGGVGKTQLLLELLYRVKEKHKRCSIIWIPATTAESLHQGYIHVARKLGVSGLENEEADVKQLVQDHLEEQSTDPWLLVFDNADDIGMWIDNSTSADQSTGERKPASHRLIDYLPKREQGCVIFTTRDRKAAVKLAPHNIVGVSAMDKETATQLFRRYLPNSDEEQKDASALLAELTYLPLAIVQAATYINENSITIADYLSLLAQKEDDVIDLLSEEFEDDGRYRNIKNPVATTWLVSFEQIYRRDPLAAEYLSFMACVDPRDIPLSLLPPGPSRKKEIDAIGTLAAYSFVTRRPADLALDLHRLVHLATRNWPRAKVFWAKPLKKQ